MSIVSGACVACGGPLEPFGPRTGYHYARCVKCRSLQLFPLPDESQIAEAYARDYASAKQVAEFADPGIWREVTANYRAALIAALRVHGARGPVVDFGTGWGFMVESLIANGFEARGVDLSRDEVAYAQARGLPVEVGDLSALHGCEGEMGAITMNAVFEHLVDHGAMLRQAWALLRDDGLVVSLHLTAGMFEWLGLLLRAGDRTKELPECHGTFSAPWHTVLFSVAGTEAIFRRHGFRLIGLRPAPQGRIPGPAGWAQRVLELANRLGWPLLRERWPLMTSHLFVFQKIRAD